jgi:two-component system cell cycle sensor histidine kinase/response regulator CckA
MSVAGASGRPPRREERGPTEPWRASAARYGQTFAHAAVGLAMTDGCGRFLQVNDAFCALTGHTAQELARLHVLAVTHPDDVPETQRLVQQLFDGDIPSFVLEKRYVRADGTAVWVQNSVSLVRDERGQPLHSVALVQDISDRKRAEQEILLLAQRLAHTEKLEAMGRLAAGVAHDMNNSLAAIAGPLQVLQQSLTGGVASPEEIRQEVQMAVRAADDAARGVRRLLRFARQSRDPGLGERQRLHLGTLLDDVVALTRPRWRDDALAHDCQIEVIVESRAATAVLASAAELRDALVNLVNNAVDALPAGGAIRLLTRDETGPDGGRAVVVSVADTGTGMDAETQRRLFEPFYTTKPPGKGTGLGMPMVAGIVERHGGTIDVRSAPGQGTSIALRLPAYVEDDADAEPAMDKPSGGRQWRLLLVDDEVTTQAVATRLLQRDGHHVTAVTSAERALAILDRAHGAQAFDALVTDVGLPGLSGWELIDRVHRSCPRLPIIVATGWGYSMTADDLAQHGISPQQVVAKPFHIGRLHQALEAAIAAMQT